MARTTDTANHGRKKRRSFRKRDYKAEYHQRVERGLSAGKSRAAARGHPRAEDLAKQPVAIDRTSALEKALAKMRRGASQAQAARSEGVSVEKLRRHRLINTASQMQGGRWIIFDSRPQAYWIASGGKQIKVVVPNDEGVEISAYWRAVDKFLLTNDDEHLHPFEGEGVYDTKNRFHQFETRPNVLRKLEAIGELNFIEIYADGGGNG